MGTLHEDVCIFVTVSRSVLLRMKNVLDKYRFHEKRGVYEIIWKKYGRVMQATDDNIIRRMRSACWITNTIDTGSEYVILIDFPL
jgi:hypothetical protein